MIFLASRSGIARITGDMVASSIARVGQENSFPVPLLLPALADEIDVILLTDPATPWPAARLRKAIRPAVVLIGDDPGPALGFGGPDNWRCALKIGGWCNAAIVHGAGGEPQHYAEAACAAGIVGKVAIVETTSAHAMAWRERIACPQTLLILPKDGPHPIDRRVLH